MAGMLLSNDSRRPCNRMHGAVLAKPLVMSLRQHATLFLPASRPPVNAEDGVHAQGCTGCTEWRPPVVPAKAGTSQPWGGVPPSFLRRQEPRSPIEEGEAWFDPLSLQGERVRERVLWGGAWGCCGSGGEAPRRSCAPYLSFRAQPRNLSGDAPSRTNVPSSRQRPPRGRSRPYRRSDRGGNTNVHAYGTRGNRAALPDPLSLWERVPRQWQVRVGATAPLPSFQPTPVIPAKAGIQVAGRPRGGVGVG